MTDPSAPLVSVVIPAFNAAPWIESTVRSALNQSYRALEVLVADDGSTDETLTILTRIVEEDARLRIIGGTHCGHPGKVRNRALSAARGSLIALLDADDLWVSTKLDSQLEAMRSNPGANLCVASGRFLMPDDSPPSLERPLPQEQASPPLRPPLPTDPAAFESLVTRHRTIHTSSVLLTRQLLEEIGPFSEDPSLCSGQDDDLIFRAWKKGIPVTLPSVFVFARRRTGSVSSVNSWENIFSLLKGVQDRGDLDPAFAGRAWSAAWIVRAERGLRTPGKAWRGAMIQAWRLDPLNPRRLPALLVALLPRRLASALYFGLSRSFASPEA